MITIKQLQNFLILSEELHFAKAAEKLNMSQAALSKEIQKLEQKIECKLFDRSNKWDIKLTEAGKAYLEQISEIPNLLEHAKIQALHAQRGLIGQLSIGITSIVCNYLDLGSVFKKVQTKYPNVSLHITELYTPFQTLDKLKKNELDLSIIPIADFSKLPENFKYKIISEFQLLYVLSANNPLAVKEKLSITDLANSNFIMPSKNTSRGLRNYFELFFMEKCHKKPTISHEIDGLESSYQLISANLGVSILPETNFPMRNYNLVFRPCDLNLKCFNVIVWDENNHSQALTNILKLF